MVYEEKGLTQDEFIDFYEVYVQNTDKVSLAAWIIRILPREIVIKLIEDARLL
jgi:hypothetical protein